MTVPFWEKHCLKKSFFVSPAGRVSADYTGTVGAAGAAGAAFASSGSLQ